MLNKNVFAHFMSFACVIHCIGLPILIMVVPTFAHSLENPLLELGLLILSIIIGSFIVYQGYCKHKKRHVLFYFMIGALLWVAHLICEHYEFNGGKVYFLIGTVIVLGSYYFNHKYLKCCPSDCCNN